MRWVLAVALLLIAVGCGSANRVVISPGGRVGALRTDRSTAADVIAFAGKPDATRDGSEYDSRPYLALGYECSAKPSLDRFPVLETPKKGRTGPNCRTVFWVNRRTGKLGDFFTTSQRYEERDGVRIGMRTAEAERLLHQRVGAGCEENIYLGNREAPLTVAFAGGHSRLVRGSSRLHLVGGHVSAFTLHGRRSDIGIFDCL